MSVVNQNNTVLKSQSLGSRVFQKRKSNDAVVFADSDIDISFTVNVTDRTAAGAIIITFDKVLSYIAGSYTMGDNAKTFKILNNVNSITKNVNINQDGNGAGNGSNFESFISNRFHLSKTDDITSLTISQSNSGIQSVGVNIRSSFPSLINYIVNIFQVPNFSFLANIPQILNLNLQISISSFSNLLTLKNSNLKSLILRGYNTTQPELLLNLPASLYYLEITQMTNFVVNLPDYFTGTRIAINFSTGQSIYSITYSGTCIFPSVIADTPQYRIPSTGYLYNQMNNRLNGMNLSKFLIDFANQVQTISLGNSGAKRMKFTDSTVDSSYVDPDNAKSVRTASQAITKIGSLGISISFS